ncbi:MAG: hypothetical protein DRQ88_08545 [Epsilonproteobacteria bacterium]|nr:MAG: hypothetical protein DRQ89_09975 [Campylobacterota bacterium]RLA65916.1 MAG: hypothetical protein DRQ88_08545 [Campylobacterota bacterium]
MKTILQITFFLSLFSCGIIKTQKEYISIDSNPRGLVVYHQQAGKKTIKKIGSTPMFLNVSKNSEDIYIMKDPLFESKSVKTSPKSICRHYQKGEQFTLEDETKKDTNLIKTFVSRWMPRSLLKGSSYECISIVRAKLKGIKSKKLCRTYLIIPPKNYYLKVSLDLAKAWEQQVFNKQKNKCDKVITPLVSESYMLFLGIDELTAPTDITELEYQKFLKLGAKFKATDIVFLPYEQESKTFTVTPKIYDVHTTKASTHAPDKKFKKNLEISGGYKFSNAFLSSFRFIPNGVAFQGKFRNKLHGEGEDASSLDSIYDNFNPGVSVNNIVYPQYRWKNQTMVTPYIVWEYWGEDLELDLYGVMLNMKWFWHLPPGGVFVARAGFGATYISAKYDDIGYRKKVGTWIASLSAEYYFFPWQRIYILGGYRKFFIPDVISGPNFAITGESRLFLNIGYFWPEFRTAVRRWINL